MKKVIAALALLALALPVLAMDIAKDPAVVTEGIVKDYDDIIVRGDAAVVSIIDGTFTDLGPAYFVSVGNNSYDPDLYYDPHGSVDYSTYLLLVVDSSDLWWAYDWTAEINAWTAYMDGGGNMLLVGQDFLYSSLAYSFPTNYCGMTGVFEDANYGDAGMLNWTGTDVLPGLSDSMLPCFASNPWFTDDVSGTFGVCDWNSPQGAGGCGSASMVGIFSTVEFGCTTNFRGVLDEVIGAAVAWFAPTATDEASFSSVKTLY